jgi:hypothetical protein
MLTVFLQTRKFFDNWLYLYQIQTPKPRGKFLSIFGGLGEHTT